MIPKSLNRGGIILLHILFWVLYGALLYASLVSWRYPQSVVWTSLLSDLATSVTISYLNYMVLLPWLYGRGKYGIYLGSAISVMLILIVLRVTLVGITHRSVVYTYFIRTIPIIGFYFLSTVIWFFNNMISARRREVELRNSQLDSELKFLKLQLSPHFLFNTLNNIYSMAYFNDANTAPAILKLAGLMRHMLHEGQDKFISLSKEVSFMENFIELWRLKLDDKPRIVFNHNGITEGHRIAPMVFLAFLENAFKHGNTMNGNISVDLNVTTDNMLHLKIKNDVIQGPNTLEEKSGIGLTNVQKRLNLIYPGKYQLDLLSKPDYYEVNLTIEIG